jgi:hypothetical protein
MQLLVVSTCVGTLVELFRVVPLLYSLGRTHIGRRLTEKERNQAVGLLKPLSIVDKIHYSRLQARYLLYFMVMFVYSTISPLTNWFCVFFFLFLGSVYRYQFVFNYPNTPDTGGEIWLTFMRVILACIVVAQLTVVGFLFLKVATIAAALMIPLVVITCLFIIYVSQCHFVIGKYLPARTCRSQDLANEDDEVDYSEFKNSYKNPALMARFLDADWSSGKPSESQTAVQFADAEEKEAEADEEGYDGFANKDEEADEEGYDGFANKDEENVAENQKGPEKKDVEENVVEASDENAKEDSFFGNVFRAFGASNQAREQEDRVSTP